MPSPPRAALAVPAAGRAPERHRSRDSERSRGVGLAAIEQLLRGGFPRGRVSEIAGPASCGRTSLAHALLARTTSAGELACVIDLAGGFDPPSAAEAGVALSRVLWVRPPGLREALRCAEHVLRTEGFALVLLDLAGLGAPLRIASSVWPRLRKRVASTCAVFLVLGHQRVAGSFADLALELGSASARFETGPAWLCGLGGSVRIARNRLGPDGRQAEVRWGVEPWSPPPESPAC